MLILAGSVGLVAIFAAIIRRHPALYAFAMGGGAAIWGGNVLWCVGRPFFPHRILVGAFLLVTIAGERLGSWRLQQSDHRGSGAVSVPAGSSAHGLVLLEWSFDAGVRLAGAGLLVWPCGWAVMTLPGEP